MKHISFYQWLVNSGANAQKNNVETCHRCAKKGYGPRYVGCEIIDGVFVCESCGSISKVEKLHEEYVHQVSKDDGLMAKLQKAAAILLLAVSFWACPPLPSPAPEPPPEPPKRHLVADFDGFQATYPTLWDTSLSHGQASACIDGVLALSGASGVSAWISSAKNYHLDSLQSFQVAVTLTTGDFRIGITPARQVNRYSVYGFYPNDEILGLYFYRKLTGELALYEYFKETGRQPFGSDIAPNINLSEPCVLEFTFDAKSRRLFMWYGGSELMQEIGSEILGPSWGDSVAFEIIAHDTPRHGEARIDWAKVEYYAAPDTAYKPTGVILYWDRNQKKDGVKEYIAKRWSRDVLTYYVTIDTFKNFQLTDTTFFNVTAKDSSGNVSQPSNTVRWPEYE
jgi:hypothetical protein